MVSKDVLCILYISDVTMSQIHTMTYFSIALITLLHQQAHQTLSTFLTLSYSRKYTIVIICLCTIPHYSQIFTYKRICRWRQYDNQRQRYSPPNPDGRASVTIHGRLLLAVHTASMQQLLAKSSLFVDSYPFKIATPGQQYWSQLV